VKKLVFGFDGPNGAGKTTVMEMVYQMLHKTVSLDTVPVSGTRFPGGTSIGQKIRNIVLDTTNEELSPEAEFLLFAADDAQAFHQMIDCDRSEKSIWLTDRTWLSSLCFQGARGVDKDFIRMVSRHHQQTKYDAIFVFNLPRLVAEDRLSKRALTLDRIESFDDDLQDNIFANWGKVADENPDENIVELNACRDPDSLALQVFQIIMGEFNA
jgi:dTMP kinase